MDLSRGLGDVYKRQTSDEVTKAFVNAASFMISVALGGTGKSGEKFVRKGRPLWDTKQLAPQQWLS
jgi:hypothetical protein